MTLLKKKLPIGIQTFREIRQDNCYYVDKTAFAVDLLQRGKHYFLSRPRRFGKSLFLDTLKELFEGNQPLFEGLAVEKHWDWSCQYPVLRFSFASKSYSKGQDLSESLHGQLTQLENTFNMPRAFDDAGGRFSDLLIKLHKKTGQRVVVLVDEYDKPILDALQNPEIARSNRDLLRGFYGAIKDYDAHIKFSFLTGVSKFSKVSLFSGLNNLKDITLSPRYSAICGYTDRDIDTVFSPELEALDREKIRAWYNGYNWLGDSVYNPFDILLLFDERQFKNYWFETGTPRFLLDEIFKRGISTPALGKLYSDDTMLSSFEIDHIVTEALLFQTGYLTIKSSRETGGQTSYILGYPNQEVYQSLNNVLLASLSKDPNYAKQRTQLYDLLLENDFKALKGLFHSFYASIPHQWYTSNDIQHFEGFYASVFYSYFAALGLDVVVEDSTNAGRIDMALMFNQHVYIFEFKVVELSPTGSAMKQIKAKKYADKYRARHEPIHLIGVEFSKESRNIVGFEVEKG